MKALRWMFPVAFAIGAAMTALPAMADEFMDKVKAEVEKFAGPQSDWRGPTTAPKLATGKKVAYLSSNQQNDASREWGTHIANIGKKIGWEVIIIDGRGTPVGWQEGVNQAIALQVDGIVMDADAASLQPQIKDAISKGITVVGIHASGFPGRSRSSVSSSTSSRIRATSAGPRPTGSFYIRAARRARS